MHEQQVRKMHMFVIPHAQQSLILPICFALLHGRTPMVFPTFHITHEPNPSLSLKTESIFIPDHLHGKSPALTNALAGFLLGVDHIHNQLE